MVQPQELHKPPLRSVLEAHVTVTAASYTAKAGDCLIGVNRAGAVTVTLPTAEVRNGRVYTVKDESGAAATNNITVATEGAQTIDGSATDVVNLNYQSKSYYSDGKNWFILPVTPDTNTQLSLSTTVSTQAHGDSAAAGSASDASKGDHKHAMPAAGGPSQATQAAIEAETNEDTYAPPDLLKHAPGMTKAYTGIKAAGTIETGDYLIASVTDSGTGDRTINFTDTFDTSDEPRANMSGLSADAGVGGITPLCSTRGTTAVDCNIRNDADSLVDARHFIAIWGNLS